jgi:hypothetical protein
MWDIFWCLIQSHVVVQVVQLVQANTWPKCTPFDGCTSCLVPCYPLSTLCNDATLSHYQEAISMLAYSWWPTVACCLLTPYCDLEASAHTHTHRSSWTQLFLFCQLVLHNSKHGLGARFSEQSVFFPETLVIQEGLFGINDIHAYW